MSTEEVQGASRGLETAARRGRREPADADSGFVRYPLAEEYTLHVLSTGKFKTVAIRFILRRALRKEEVSANAAIPFVLRRGSRDYPDSRAVARFLEHLYGAEFEVDSLKVGETQVLAFDLAVAADRYLGPGEAVVREALRFLGSVLLSPAEEAGGFRPDVLAQEVDGLRRRIEGIINQKRQYALERLRQEMCRDEPFGLHRYGSVEDLEALRPDSLLAHYERVLRESPADIFVVGDVDEEQVKGWVEEALPLPRGQVSVPPPPAQHWPEHVREVVEEDDVQQGILTFGCRLPLRYPDDGYERVMVYNGILGAYPHSKMFINVREKASLAYFAGTRMDSSKGILMAVAGINPAKVEQARSIMERQFDDMAAGRFTEEELEATRKALIHGLRTVGDSPGALIQHQMVGVVNGRQRSPEQLIQAIQEVSAEDVREVARRVRLDTVYFLTRFREGQ